MSDEGRTPPLRRIRSFAGPRSRLTEGQKRAWDQWWREWGHEVSELVSGAEKYDPVRWFGRSAPLVLEIGPGDGTATAEMAAAAPEVDHLAVDVFEPGLARLILLIRERGLTNLRLVRGDAVDLLREVVPEESLAGIRIYFPDPWPKRRHHKRRLIQPPFVALAASRLQPGGVLHLATDWADYAQQMRAVCDAEPRLEPTGDRTADGWWVRPSWRPVTKFERRAHQEGRDVHDLLYRRVRTPQ